jgi:hypothetical protein
VDGWATYHFYKVIDLKSNRANITRSWPALQPRSKSLARFFGGYEEYIAYGLFTPNRPHIVPVGLGAIEEVFSSNKRGVFGRKIVVPPHSAKQ